MSLKFIKKKEDFVCENCGAGVMGDGFTNHCPECLYSKHVDVFPGDRAAECGAIMKPVMVESARGRKAGEWDVVHKCVTCGHEKRNKLAKDDNFDILVKPR